MTYTPSLEEFLTQHQPDEDAEELAASPNSVRRAMGLPEAEVVGTGGALDSIARSMEALVSLVQRLDAEASDVARLRDNLAGLQAEYDALDTAYCKLEGQLDEVREVCKPSTSKLANSIRVVLDPEPVAEEPAAATEPEGDTTGLIEPHSEAPVEEWREYARGCGYQGPDVDKANRSQIRTMLGIAQPVTS